MQSKLDSFIEARLNVLIGFGISVLANFVIFPLVGIGASTTQIITVGIFMTFVPYRLVWSNFKAFMGEQKTPGASTDYLVPQCLSPAGGWPIGSLGDYFGLPTVGQVSAGKQIGRAHV